MTSPSELPGQPDRPELPPEDVLARISDTIDTRLAGVEPLPPSPMRGRAAYNAKHYQITYLSTEARGESAGSKSVEVKGRENTRSPRTDVWLEISNDGSLSLTIQHDDEGDNEPEVFAGRSADMLKVPKVVYTLRDILDAMEQQEVAYRHEYPAVPFEPIIRLPNAEQAPPRVEAGVAMTETHEQDAALVDPANGIYIVCDGVTAESGSATTARMTAVRLHRDAPQTHDEQPVDPATAASAVAENMNAAHDQIIAWRDRDGGRGSTTATFFMLIPVETAEGTKYYGVLAAVGDSPAKLVHPDGTVEKLTTDEVETNRFGGKALANCLGKATAYKGCTQTRVVELPPGSRLLLASDGLSSLTDEQIQRMIGQGSVQEAAEALVAAAGDNDDKTAIVVRIGTAAETKPGPQSAATQLAGSAAVAQQTA